MESTLKKPGQKKIDFENVEQVSQKVREAVRRALSRHKVMKNPLPTWDEDHVRIVQPEDLPGPDQNPPAGS